MAYAQRRARSSIVEGAKAHNFQSECFMSTIASYSRLRRDKLHVVGDFISLSDPCALSAQVSDQEITTASFDRDSFANIENAKKPYHEDICWQVLM